MLLQKFENKTATLPRGVWQHQHI